MPLCEQKSIEKVATPKPSNTPTSGTTTPTPTPEPEPTPTPTPTPAPTPEPEPTPTPGLTPKNVEAEIRNAGPDVVPERVQTSASELSNSAYEASAEKVVKDAVSNPESAARAVQAAADRAATNASAEEAERAVNEIIAAAETGGQEAADAYAADLFNQFLEGGE